MNKHIFALKKKMHSYEKMVEVLQSIDNIGMQNKKPFINFNKSFDNKVKYKFTANEEKILCLEFKIESENIHCKIYFDNYSYYADYIYMYTIQKEINQMLSYIDEKQMALVKYINRSAK